MESSHSVHSPESLLSNAGFVRNLARSLLRDPHSADDVAQDTLVAAMERPPRSDQGLRTWLASVVRNVVRNNARGEGRRRWREASAARAESTPSTDEILEREALRATVVQAVLALSEPSRSAVLLRYYEDKTPREIARLLGVPVETVRTRIKRGLAEMRRGLDASIDKERGGWVRALIPLAMASSAATVPVGAGVLVAASVGLVLLAGGGWRILGGSTRTTLVPVEGSAVLEPARAALVEAEAPSRVQAREPVAAATSASEHELSGTVADSRGRPLSAVLYVSPDGPPPERFRYHPEWIARLQQEGVRFGFAETEASGHFRAEFPDFQHVYVAVVDPRDAYLWADPQLGRWLDLPAKNVAFQVADAPSAEVTATVRVEETGQQLDAFTCGLWRASDGLVLPGVQSQAGRALCKLPFLPTRTPDEFQLSIEDERLGRASTRVSLSPGDRRAVEILFHSPLALTGQVLDPNGVPVEGALVCSGTACRLRGDEPFKPFDPARVKDGALTDAGGWFALEATERYVTVWHAGWSPKTVRREEAALVRLEPRASLRGRLLQPDGSPMGGAKIALDRKRESVTDELGRFAFEDVEAGVRGLKLPTKRLVSVIVPAGGALEVELGAEQRLDLTFDVRRGGSPCLDAFEGVGVGLDRLSEVFEFGAEHGLLHLSTLLPGRYVLLAGTGDVAVLDLVLSTASVELGTTPLTVHATPGKRLYLVPAGANELVELMAGRAASRTVGADGVVQYPGLSHGRYGVGIDSRGVQVEVEIADEPVELRLE